MAQYIRNSPGYCRVVNIFHRDVSLELMASAKFVQVYLGLVI